MKTIQFLSPTSINKFYDNPVEFYLTYLADNRPPKLPQTPPMSVGSGFDAFVKSYLHEALFGKGKDPKFSLMAIFEAQVEPQNRDGALAAGNYLFLEYKKSGSLADLMLELQNAVGDPRFELEVRGAINGHREGVTKIVEGMILLGKPDVFFINSAGAHVILDWKVNGYYSNFPPSPMPGYVRLRQNGWNRGCHKDCQEMIHNGMKINAATYLEKLNVGWATQLTIYAWLCGIDVGAECITAIDQLVCKKVASQKYPDVRFADHRLRVSGDFQFNVLARAQHIWEVVHSDHIFRDLTIDESKAKCKVLDNYGEILKGDGSPNDLWFAKMVRS